MSLKFKCLLKRNIKGPLKKLLWNLSLSLFFLTWRPQLIFPCTLFFQTERWEVNLALLSGGSGNVHHTCQILCNSAGQPRPDGLGAGLRVPPCCLCQVSGAPAPGAARLCSNRVKYTVGLGLGRHFYFHLWQTVHLPCEHLSQAIRDSQKEVTNASPLSLRGTPGVCSGDGNHFQQVN